MKRLFSSIALVAALVAALAVKPAFGVSGKMQECSSVAVSAVKGTGDGFQLGAAVSNAASLAQDGSYFVLRGNAATEFTSSTGAYTEGVGPEYLIGTSGGSKVATMENVVKFIPCGNDKYLLYWPAAGCFLKNSGSVYNGINGWQYTTTDVSEAAMVELSPLSSGDFEIFYRTIYKNNNIANYFGKLYVGAEMRLSPLAKMKTFSPEKKQALDNGDYTQGYSLPMAFNWSLYAATFDSSIAAGYDADILQIMETLLTGEVSFAKLKLQVYDNFSGMCSGGENVALGNAINVSQNLLAAQHTIAELREQYTALNSALLQYVVVKLDVCRKSIEELLSTSNFSDTPAMNTYPTSSRDMLNGLIDRIEEVEANLDTYTAEAIELECEKIDAEIAAFYSTKIKISSLPICYNSSDGLPGSVQSYGGNVWSTPVIYFSEPVTTLRVMFKSTLNEELYNGYPMVNLAEFEVYDGDGKKVSLSYYDFTTNSQEYVEGYIENLCDGNTSNFWHSAYSPYSTMSPIGYVYLDITLPTAMQVLSFTMYGRNQSNVSKFPTDIVVTTPMNAMAMDNLQPFVDQAHSYKQKYGNFDGKYSGTAITTFENTLASAEAVVAKPSPTSSDISYWSSALSTATKNYVACKLDVYKLDAGYLMIDEEFSAYPAVGTYPESSRLILEDIIATMDEVKANLDIYTIENLEELYSRIEGDFETFYSTKVAFLALPLVYDAQQGLPGVQQSYGGYMWDTPLVKLSESNMGVRVEFLASNTPGETYNGYPVISIADVELYDGKGEFVPLTANNFMTNSQESGEGELKNICDGNMESYWLSACNNASISPAGNVYIDIVFPTPMNEYSLVIFGRDNAEYMPAKVRLSTIKESVVERIPVNGENAYVYLSNGGVEAFAVQDIAEGYYMLGDYMCVPLTSGDVIYYTAEEYDSVSVVSPRFPEFTSYKFNNKYNPNLNVDAIAATIEEEMNFSLNAIGKWLTASFQLSDDRAVVYIDTVQQHSKVTRQSFATPKNYVVTYPGYKKYTSVKIADEVWEYSGGAVTEIPLTADMLATNKPANEADQGLGAMLDGDPDTKFHSTWGSANNATLYVDAYITIDLPSAIEKMKLYYKCRTDVGGYNPLILDIFASNDGATWEPVRTLTTADGMPTGGVGSEYTSPVISLNGSYKHLKLLQTSGEYPKNHLTLSEMRIYNVASVDSTLVSNAVYATKGIPFGREYKVGVNWLVDNATSVPRIDIDIDGGEFVTSKETYLKAKFRITGYGVYDNFEDSVQIKGRGNTTWSYSKKPYRLKFASKVKPFGLTKGKSWVLLANAQKGSMLANAVAMKIGQIVGAEYANHIIPVELYMNGVYMGSYMFTEKVGMSNNSVDISEYSSYLLELDSYYDEDYKFRSAYYKLPVNIKDPDLSEYTSSLASTRKTLIENDFNALDAVVYSGGKVEDLLDVDAFARFMLTNDLVCNQELGHPKSTYLFKEDFEYIGNKIKFGPLWDFDWAFGYEGSSSYCETSPTASLLKSSMSGEAGYKFFAALMEFDVVKKHYYKVWNEFLDKNSMEELIDYMDCYYNFAKSSFENNATLWNDGTGYAAINTRMQEWLNTRAEYIYDNLDVYDLEEFLYALAGDVDKNNYLTIRDVALTTAYISGNVHPSFSTAKADVDGDALIDFADVAAMETALLSADFLEAAEYHETPVAKGGLKVDDFVPVMFEDYTLPIKLQRSGDENYKAMQVDITAPDGMMIYEATAAAATLNHRVTLTQRDMTTYRLVIYSDNDEAFNPGEDVVAHLVLNCFTEIPAENCNIEFGNILVVDEAATDEFRMDNVIAQFGFKSSALVGDVNEDNSVDVADITKVVSIILGTGSTSAIADVNNDGSVDVADITKIISIILGSDKAPVKRAASARKGAPSVISATDGCGELSIKVDNPDYAFSAMQFDLCLPEGIEVASAGESFGVTPGRRAGQYTAPVCAMQPDGTLRVMIYSLSNDNFADNAGEVANVELKIDAALEGEFEFEIKNAIISSLGSKECLAPHKGVITVKSGIAGSVVEKTEVDADALLYDLSGRRVKEPQKHGIYIKGNKKYIE